MAQQATRGIDLAASRTYHFPTPPPGSRPTRRTADVGRRIGSVVWALVPLVTFGWFTWAAFAVASLRTRRGSDIAAMVVYFLCFVATVVIANATHSSVWMYIPLAVPWLVGAAHAIAVRERVFDLT